MYYSSQQYFIHFFDLIFNETDYQGLSLMMPSVRL